MATLSIIIVDIVILLMVAIVIFLTITAISHLFIPVPYVPTPNKVVQKMIKLAELKAGQIVYDLGAGDGRLLIQAKKDEPKIIAKGYELVLLVWMLGKLHIWWNKVKIEWRMKNLLSVDVRDADVIFLYLIPSLMKKLEKKFEEELKQGTRIVSHSFTFKDRVPLSQTKVKSYMGQTTVRVYVW